MPDLALVVSKFFLNLSKYALTFYHSYQKTKKTQEKEKELGSSRAEKTNKTPLKKPLTAYILYFRSKVSSFQ
jgi:hypothetical protein